MTFKFPSEPALVVVSDVHVRTSEDARYALLCQLVEEAVRVGARALVLNGDIFDFFFGWRSYFREKYSRLFKLLDLLAAQGATVWFVEGNHEFGLDGLNSHVRFKVVDSRGGVMTGPDGKRILVAHGDLLSPDFNYRLFRGVIRSRLVHGLAFLFPQRFLDAITLWVASTSRKKDKYRELKHEQIRSMAARQLLEHRADVIIFGHFHHPYDDTLTNVGRLLSVNSWDQPSCLLVSSSGEILRIRPE